MDRDGEACKTARGEDEHRPNLNEVVALDEVRLVVLAQTGDKKAFEELYRRHVGRIYALCLRMSGNKSVAEEFTQDCFVHAWIKLGSFKKKSKFGTWLHRLSVNVVLGRFRSRSRYTARVVSMANETRSSRSVVPAKTPGTRMDLEVAISALPQGARTVFTLYEVEGYRHEEISKILGISQGTSKAHLHRARKLLREFLK